MDRGRALLVHTEQAALVESDASTGQTGPTGLSPRRSRSSAGERLLHTQDVASSILAATTGDDPIAEMLADDAWRMNVESRFWPKVMKPLQWDACWPWTGAKRGDRQGYGNFKIKSYVAARAHRVSYALYYGQSPGSMLVCHKCDNPVCVNPAHLFLGTVQDNSDDMVRKGRSPRRDQKGEKNAAAKLTSDDVAAIRRLIAAGHTNIAIAERYSVTHSLISRIRRGRAWAA